MPFLILYMKKFIYPLLFVLLYSCSTPQDNLNNTDNFDRKPLLENVVDNIIIPSYDNLLIKLNELKVEADTFSNHPSANHLSILREKWVDAYIAWQYVEIFEIGKAEEIRYARRMNTYPTNTVDIDDNISNGVSDLSTPTIMNYARQGFPALDYMLYGLGGDSNLVFNYYINQDGSLYLSYLNVLIDEMVNNTSEVIAYWQNNRNIFINSTNNTATSSLNKLVNDYIYYYEKGFRANKIGIPAGIWSNDLPENVEAYYKRDLSKTLCLVALDVCHNFFIGKHFDNQIQGASLKDYVDYITTNPNLSAEIISNLDSARTQINLLNDDFAFQVQTNNILMLEAYDAVQVVTRLLKTDMLTFLNIQTDYVDSDGD